MIKEYKLETIKENIEARQKEIAGYEINIFNYEFIRDNAEEADPEFLKQVNEGIQSNIFEMKKIQMVLKALEAQQAYLQTQ
jgi:hypothetical protein